jgi:hypothetical protein
MPTYRGLRAPRPFNQDLIRRIQRDVLPRAQLRLYRSDDRINRYLTLTFENTQRLLDPEPASRRSVVQDAIK